MRLSTLHTLCTEANQAEDNLLRPSTWNVLDVQHLRGCWHLEIKNKHLPQVVHIPLFPHPCCLDLLSLGICYNGKAVTNTDRLNLLMFFSTA